MPPKNETNSMFREIDEPEYEMTTNDVVVLTNEAIKLGLATVDDEGNLIPVKE